MDDETEIVAYHETEHAVVAHWRGGRVLSVTIAPDRDDGPLQTGDTRVAWSHDRHSPQQMMELTAHLALAGPVAEMICRGEPFYPGVVPEWDADEKLAWQTMGQVLEDPSTRLRVLEEWTVRLHQYLRRDQSWSTLAKIVDPLLAYETLEQDELERVWRLGDPDMQAERSSSFVG